MIDQERYQNYIKGLRRTGLRILVPRKLGLVGKGYRRSSKDIPFDCEVVGSFSCFGSGGYFVRKFSNNKIVQIQVFREGESK